MFVLRRLARYKLGLHTDQLWLKNRLTLTSTLPLLPCIWYQICFGRDSVVSVPRDASAVIFGGSQGYWSDLTPLWQKTLKIGGVGLLKKRLFGYQKRGPSPLFLKKETIIQKPPIQGGTNHPSMPNYTSSRGKMLITDVFLFSQIFNSLF